MKGARFVSEEKRYQPARRLILASQAGARGAPRYERRLSDKILIAFDHACDQGDLEIAELLLRVVEMMLRRMPTVPDGSRRRTEESLVAEHERLWLLRHPDTGEC
jgi:hypothetical protein